MRQTLCYMLVYSVLTVSLTCLYCLWPITDPPLLHVAILYGHLKGLPCQEGDSRAGEWVQENGYILPMY